MVPVWNRVSRRQFVAGLAALSLPVSSISCGTLLHPERIGQPRTGRLDPAVCILDGVGCLLFVVPGVLAFIVDYASGALFLPPGYAAEGSALDPDTGLVRVPLPADAASLEELERELAKHVGRPVDLSGPGAHVERYDALADLPTELVRAQSPDAGVKQ
ncbi:hypothetical protein [Alienimonas californiensis]|uniref:Uncharacterized protein n=1 Tax=Alienimonas californiensis TaxID=2527989 RepID=A0A517PE55_9PLAN|nr:hypothetical protein [Alienimonas californiensis]QDT17653.1 hypothetical protein CA12_37830 [Alienimonas californiensis]